MIGVLYVNPNVPYLDHLLFLERYIGSGEKISLEMLWRAHDGHRLPGYLVIFFLNVKYFNYNQSIEILPSIAVYAVGVIFLLKTFLRTMSNSGPSKMLFVIFVTVILMNGQYLVASTYSIIATRFFNFALFIFLLSLIYTRLKNPDKVNITWLWFIMLLALPIFGRGWGISVAVVILVLTSLWRFQNRDTGFRALILISTPVFMIVFLYLNSIMQKTGTALISNINTKGLIDFYILKLGSANLSLFDYRMSNSLVDWALFPTETLTVLAYLFCVIYVVSVTVIIWAVLTKRIIINRAVWLALFLVLFPLVATFSVSILRYTDGTPFVSRHNFELSVGLAGLAYFSYYLNERVGFPLKAAMNTLVVVGIILSCKTYIVKLEELENWSRFYDQLAQNLDEISIDKSDPKRHRKALCRRVDNCQTVLLYVREKNLAGTR